MKQPPKYPLRFFRWFCHPDYVEDIEGDLLERFEKRTNENRSARWLFALDVLRLFRPGIIRNFEGTQKINHYGMFKHNLKIAWRNLIRRKAFTFINIGGLVLGLTTTLLIALWIHDELSFNKENENYEYVARVMEKANVNGEIHTTQAVPLPLTDALREQYGSSFEHIVMATWFGDYLLARNETSLNVRGGFMESKAPHLMALKMTKGNRGGLTEEAAILLSKSTAKALFGDQDPLNQPVRIHNQVDMIVKGIYQDFPRSSSFHSIKFIGSWDFFVAIQPWMQENIRRQDWTDNSYQLFVQIPEKTSFQKVSDQIERVKQRQLSDKDKALDSKLFLHPMKDWHLRSRWENGEIKGALIQYVWWFGVIGGFVLLLACINFMNLSTALSIHRAKEVGVRKSLGSFRGQLVAQFLTESMLLAVLAFIIATMIAILLVPTFNILTEKQMTLPVSSPTYWMMGIGVAMITGLIAGSYPGIFLSSFKAIQVLKGTYQNKFGAVFFRKAMVVFQFTISIALIIGTLIILQQVEHSRNRPLGYEKNGAITIEMTSPGHYSKGEAIKNDLLNSGAISHFAQSSAPLTEIWNVNDNFSWAGIDPGFRPRFCTFFVTHDFGPTIEWDIVKGRDFSQALSTDSSAMIINEAAARYIGMADPLGMEIQWFKKFKIIGVIKDIMMESPFTEIQPAMYVINPGGNINFNILRLNSDLSQLTAVSKIEEVFEKHLPNVPFEFSFVSDVHDRKFKSIDRIGTLSSLFATLAVIISCLGLFGLASFMAEQRTKEIGIRKVLGASVVNVWKLLSKEYVGLVIISCVIAMPLAYYLLQNWLEAYEYRIEIQWWIFLIAFLGALTLTVLTISFKSIRTARANPVESLRDE